MANDLDEQSSKGFDLQHYLGLVRRRHLHFLIPFFLGWVAVWAASWVLPARYQSTTLILVTQPTMPAEYIKPNVTEDLQERLQSITQQIMSRTRLLHIIDQFDLYAAPHTHWSPDEKVVKMRKDINIELVRGQDNQITAFNLSYGSRNALQAELNASATSASTGPSVVSGIAASLSLRGTNRTASTNGRSGGGAQ